MGIALYAMFAAILIPEVKKSNKILFVALLSGLINVLLSYLKFTTQGWNLIIAIIIASAAGAITTKEKEVGACE
jgi:predicted branched-subunit amino acid permease